MNTEHEASIRGGIARRTFLGGVAAGAVPVMGMAAFAAKSGAAEPGEQAKGLGNDGRFTGVITRQKGPDNLEFPFATLNGFLTPNEQFYVRTHLEAPAVDASTWRLKVEGLVRKPFEIGYDELRTLPAVTEAATFECSGNGRVFLPPPQPSIRWELGGVSNAEWTGVRLADVLDRAGVGEGAAAVVLEGADKGTLSEPKTPGVIHFAKGLPLKKARQPEVLLAYRMNGADLPRNHGYPVRALVPGWYGTWSVKWLSRIIVTDRPFDGFFQTAMYSLWERRYGQPAQVPVTEMRVKSSIARPALHEVVPAGSKYRVIGAAWSGASAVAKVEVSTDGGEAWREARLLGKPVSYAWRLWEYDWQAPARAGYYVLMSRATDTRGDVQPKGHDEDLKDNLINYVLPVEVEVR